MEGLRRVEIYLKIKKKKNINNVYREAVAKGGRQAERCWRHITGEEQSSQTVNYKSEASFK
jgi:hypothetical protein